MNYSDDAHRCRVDFFRESGKWYTTESVPFPTELWTKESGHPIRAFAEALRRHLLEADGSLRLRGMFAVCLDPYHELGFPMMLVVGVE